MAFSHIVGSEAGTVEDSRLAEAGPQPLAGQRFAKDDAEREHVRSTIDRVAARMLR